MKVSELEGAALDYWVSQCNPVDRAPGEWHRLIAHSRGATCYYVGKNGDQQAIYAPSTKWEHGGPIIECERIDINTTVAGWEAYCDINTKMPGSTALEAAMRAYVAWKFGEEVEDAQPESAG